MAHAPEKPPPAPSPEKPPPAPSPDIKTLADAIGEAIRVNRPQGPLEQAGFSEAQIAQLTEAPKAKKYREVKCRSDETGATFTALVVESRTMVAGRIVELKRYAHPKGVMTYVSAGGLVPDGLQILRAGTAAPPEDGRVVPKHDLTPYYLQWRWVEFWQRDLRRYAGKELKAHLCISPAEFATPWQEGRVGRLIDDDG